MQNLQGVSTLVYLIVTIIASNVSNVVCAFRAPSGGEVNLSGGGGIF